MQKSIESAVKNLEVQVGQLAKQLADRPSSSFTANTKKNLKEECKVVMTRSRMEIQADEGRAEEKVEGYKQQLAAELTLELVSDFVELEEVVDEEKKKSKSEVSREKKREITSAEGKEVPYPLRSSPIDATLCLIFKRHADKEEPMASKKRKAPATTSQVRYDRSRYIDIVVPRKLLPERNMVIYHTKFDEFKEELERRKWDEELTSFDEGSIDVAIVKEFYANLYDLEDKSPKQVRVRGHLVKFDEDTLNTFLKTHVIIEEGETLLAYSRFTLLGPDPQELAAKLCILGRGFELNVDGQLLKILGKNMTILAQTWSVLSYSNLIPTSHTSDITLDRSKLIYGIIMKMDMNLGYLISHQISIIAQHDSSRLGFSALITALCKARGVTSDSRSLESLSPAINLAYIKKNCWNLDDPTVTFKGPRKAKGKRSEAPLTSTTPDTFAPSLPDPSTAPSITVPSSSTTAPLSAPSVPAPLTGPSSFTFETLFAMLQSLHRGHIIIIHRLQSSGQQPSMSMEEFLTQVACPGVQPSSGGGEASATQEFVPDVEDELVPPKPFIFETNLHPFLRTPAMEPGQPIFQDVPAASMLDLNEDQPQDEQDV
ncbi:hypothetical protein HKD37_06G017128 [Glycine soja]